MDLIAFILTHSPIPFHPKGVPLRGAHEFVVCPSAGQCNPKTQTSTTTSLKKPPPTCPPKTFHGRFEASRQYLSPPSFIDYAVKGWLKTKTRKVGERYLCLIQVTQGFTSIGQQVTMLAQAAIELLQPNPVDPPIPIYIGQGIK